MTLSKVLYISWFFLKENIAYWISKSNILFYRTPCNASLAITKAIKGYSCEKWYPDLGMQYLYQKRWPGRLWFVCKVWTTGQPSYSYSLLSSTTSCCQHNHSFNTVSYRFEYFKNSFKLFLMSLMIGTNWVLTFAIPLRTVYFLIHY